MLEYLKLRNVGLAPLLELELAPRLNLLTGDNGLGKTFLLDVAWWALTNHWPAEINPALTTGRKARPPGRGDAFITCRLKLGDESQQFTSHFDRPLQTWPLYLAKPVKRGLVLYAQVDGSFSVWDPARNYWTPTGVVDVRDRPTGYVFSPAQVWNGLEGENAPLCRGLIEDWAGWQKENGAAFQQFITVLDELSPGADEKLEPGGLTRISLNDVRDIPTVRMPYGQEVPVTQASAGMRRIIALAYLLVWTWQEHLRACELLDRPPAQHLTLFVDEVEAHLHPRWQRTIVRALLAVVKRLSPEVEVQLVATTHSPLVLASVEPGFDPERDAWFDLDLVAGKGEVQSVRLEKRPWVRHGDASRWLTSDAFDLGDAGSLEREKALAEAAVALSDEKFDVEQARQLDSRLREVLGDTDPFWMRWRFVGEKRGWLP